MIRLGIVGCADIACRRFMPAQEKVKDLEVAAVSSAGRSSSDRARELRDTYGVEIMDSHERLLSRSDLDAVYIPQPPALHYRYAKAALEQGKHVLLEKPSATSYEEAAGLVAAARKGGLALHENYMFRYHSQLSAVKRLIFEEGRIGNVRLLRADFGFPGRPKGDFRYDKALGGGALLDAGGYPIRLAAELLGGSVSVASAEMMYSSEYEVDIAGSLTLKDESGRVCQIGYGMDSAYRCSLEVWGSRGILRTNRIFTAPAGFEPSVFIETNDGSEEIRLPSDDHFLHSIEAFLDEISNPEARERMYEEVLLQAKLVERVREKSQI